MLGRRAALIGLIGMGGLAAPLAMRPTSQQPSTDLVIGLPGGPQVVIDSTLNLPVTTLMEDTSAPASDITSISNIHNAIRMPTNLAGETNPCAIAPVQVTFTDGTVADALLTLSGTFGAIASTFTLAISDSNPGITKVWATITGVWSLVGGAVQLTPISAVTAGGIVLYTGGAARMQTPGDGTFRPAPEPFHDLGSTGLVGDAGTASYKFGAEGELILSVHKSFNALGAPASPTFANALPAAYIPPASRLTGGVPISVNNAAVGNSTRLTINGATGVVTLASLPTGATAAGCDVRIPLS